MTPSADAISLLDIHGEVSVSPATECSMNDTDIQAMRSGIYDFDSFKIKTADPGREDWGGATYTLTAHGLGYDPGTSDWTQAVVSVHYYGDFSVNTKVDGVSSTTTYIWSPLGAGGSNLETNGDYQVMWTLISGSAVSVGPGFGADGVYVNLGSSGFYFSQTDTASDGTARVSTVDVTLRSRGSFQTGLDTTQRFTLTCDYDDGGPTVAWTTTARSSSSFGLGGSSAEEVGHRMYSNGTSQITNSSGTYVSSDAWCSDTSYAGTGFEMYWNKISGQTPNEIYGTEDTWLPLDGQTFRDMVFYSQSTTRSCVFDVTVREDNNASTEVTKRITLSQEWEP